MVAKSVAHSNARNIRVVPPGASHGQRSGCHWPLPRVHLRATRAQVGVSHLARARCNQTPQPHNELYMFFVARGELNVVILEGQRACTCSCLPAPAGSIQGDKAWWFDSYGEPPYAVVENELMGSPSDPKPHFDQWLWRCGVTNIVYNSWMGGGAHLRRPFSQLRRTFGVGWREGRDGDGDPKACHPRRKVSVKRRVCLGSLSNLLVEQRACNRDNGAVEKTVRKTQGACRTSV
jgi:hypothetical protein